jgi:hypothetical protein
MPGSFEAASRQPQERTQMAALAAKINHVFTSFAKSIAIASQAMQADMFAGGQDRQVLERDSKTFADMKRLEP